MMLNAEFANAMCSWLGTKARNLNERQTAESFNLSDRQRLCDSLTVFPAVAL